MLFSICRAIVLGVGLLSAQQAMATTFRISLDGDRVDLSGFITVSKLGDFLAKDFDRIVTDYSITASRNGGDAFTFTRANSSFAAPAFGENVGFRVKPYRVFMRGFSNQRTDPGSIFLVRNSFEPGPIENLRLLRRRLGYRPPVLNTVFMEALSKRYVVLGKPLRAPGPDPYQIADMAAVPLPPALWLMASALGFVACAWRIAPRLRRPDA